MKKLELCDEQKQFALWLCLWEKKFGKPPSPQIIMNHGYADDVGDAASLYQWVSMILHCQSSTNAYECYQNRLQLKVLN